MDNNLNLPLVASNQNAKHVVINDATMRLGSALSAVLTVDVTAGDAAPTLDQIQTHTVLRIIGAAVARTVTLPPCVRWLMVMSDAANAAAITLKVGTATVSVAKGITTLALLDGTANGLLGASFGNGSGGSGGDGGDGGTGTPGVTYGVVQTAGLVQSTEGTTNQTVVLTSVPVAGNVLVAFMQHYNSAPSAGAGWTMLQNVEGNVQDGTAIGWKVAGANEPLAQTPFSVGTSGNATLVMEVAGVATTAPTVFASTHEQSGTLIAIAPVTPTSNNGFIVGAVSVGDTDADFTLTGVTVAGGASGITNGRGPRRIKGFVKQGQASGAALAATATLATASVNRTATMSLFLPPKP